MAHMCLHLEDVPTELTVNSILGLRILYHLYIARIRKRELSKLPVRQNGCVNDALGVKYVSIVSRCIKGGVSVRR